MSETNERVQALLNNRRKLRILVSKMISISDLIPGRARMVVCPFHMDDHPSAKFYEDDPDGIVRLHCFGCRKQYTSYDYIKDALGQDPRAYLLAHKTSEEILTAASRTDFSYNKKTFEVSKEAKALAKVVDIDGLLDYLFGAREVGDVNA